MAEYAPQPRNTRRPARQGFRGGPSILDLSLLALFVAFGWHGNPILRWFRVIIV